MVNEEANKVKFRKIESEENPKSRIFSFVVIGFLLVFVLVLFVYVGSYFSTDEGGGNSSLLPPEPEEPGVEDTPLDESVSEPDWPDLNLCGNGIADSNENCLSCPEDFGTKCACTGSEKSFSAGLGESFTLCFDGVTTIGDVAVEFALKTKPSFQFSSGESSDTISLDEGESGSVRLSEGGFDKVYNVSLVEKIFQGAVLTLDYPVVSKEESFFAEDGQTLKLEDTGITVTFTLIDPEPGVNATVELLIDYNGESFTRTINAGENISVYGNTIICERSDDAGVVVDVIEGDEA